MSAFWDGSCANLCIIDVSRDSIVKNILEISVSNGSWPLLRVQVRLETKPLPSLVSGLRIDPNRWFGYSSMGHSQLVWIWWVVSGSPSASIYRFIKISCLCSLFVVSYQNRISGTNNLLLHVLQFAISINIQSVFYLWYVVFWCTKADNNTVMRTKIRVMPRVPNMHDRTLFMLRWRSFSGFGSEYIAVVFGSAGCHYLLNGCLQSIGIWITENAKLRIVDAPLILIPRLGQWPCGSPICIWKLPIRRLWITATKTLVNYSTYKTTNRWRSFWCIVHSTSAAIDNSVYHDWNSLIAFLSDWDLALWQSRVQ